MMASRGARQFPYCIGPALAADDTVTLPEIQRLTTRKQPEIQRSAKLA